MQRSRAITTGLLFAVMFWSCKHAPAPEATSSVLPLEQVVAAPQNYAHKLVTIHGCYVTGFERSTVQPCRDARFEQIVWVEDAAYVASLQQPGLPSIPSAVPEELRTAPKSLLVFHYDDAKNRAAWAKLRQPLSSSNLDHDEMRRYRLKVTMVGQFDTTSSRSNDGHGFGHLNQYAHQFIVLDVLEAKLVDDVINAR